MGPQGKTSTLKAKVMRRFYWDVGRFGVAVLKRHFRSCNTIHVLEKSVAKESSMYTLLSVRGGVVT